MKLIEEIKKAEEKGEILKKRAENNGQALLEKAREKGEQDLSALEEMKEKTLEKEIAEAQQIVKTEIAKIDAENEEILDRINKSYKKNKDKTVKRIQEIILKWPSSR